MEVAIRIGSGPELEEAEAYSYDYYKNTAHHRIVLKHWSSFFAHIRYHSKSLVPDEDGEVEAVVCWRTDLVVMILVVAVAHRKALGDAGSATSLLRPRREDNRGIVSFTD